MMVAEISAWSSDSSPQSSFHFYALQPLVATFFDSSKQGDVL